MNGFQVTEMNISMNYTRIYDDLISRAKARPVPSDYTETHHILPKCLGGSDDATNLVELTAREHFIAHQLLVKIHPQNRSLLYAAVCMTVLGEGQQGRANNRLYGWLKTQRSQVVSRQMKNLWANTQHREERISSIHMFTSSNEFKEKQSKISKATWQKAEPARHQQIRTLQKEWNGHVAEHNKELWQTSQYKEKMKNRRRRGSDGSKMKEKWADPEWRERMMVARNKERKNETS